MRAVFSQGSWTPDLLEVLKSKTAHLPHVFLARGEPIGSLFSRAQILVHHGGIGTTGEALRAGVPMVVLADDAETPANAFQITRVGCGVGLLESSVTSRILNRLLTQVKNERFKVVSQAIAEQMSQEDGLKQSLVHIENSLRQR